MTARQRRTVGLFGAMLVLCLAAGLLHILATKRLLQAQLQVTNADVASLLASALGSQTGGPASWPASAALKQAASRALTLRLLTPDGRVVVDQKLRASATQAPAWFSALLLVRAPPLRVEAVSGSTGDGELQFALNPADAQDALWSASLQAAVVVAFLGLSIVAACGWVLRRSAVGVATEASAEDARPAIAAPPVDADLAQAHAGQVARLLGEAQLDPVSGLPLRRFFVGRLQQRLAEPGGPGVALLLVRLLHLDAMNLRLGHQATDQLLGAVADVLLTYVDRVPGTFAGRLNGSDFALCLPVPGVALETAASLHTALTAAPALRSGGAAVVVGGIDGLQDSEASLALGAADAALARAEAATGDAGGLVVEAYRATSGAAAGARAWREQIGAALAEGRIRLASRAVHDSQGRELHLECALHVQLSPDGAYQAAEHWLALARRSRLLAEVDLATIDLALQANTADGRQRAVPVSPLSLATPGFLSAVAIRLADAPEAARGLLFDCRSGGLHPADATAALAAWRPLGARVGVDYANAEARHLPALQAVGIHHVRIDARHLQGIAANVAVQTSARGLVALIHGLALQAWVGGISDAEDLALLWLMGFDGTSQGLPEAD